ncbi:hypothetical protein [Pimelobacter simplex]|uniref:hypothetical protein n=1 Tax=Nocardioides simplex TaxID=2045 RepID=UPI001932AAA2|nr:hypothetical protein [Pimelobacter simplex]
MSTVTQTGWVSVNKPRARPVDLTKTSQSVVAAADFAEAVAVEVALIEAGPVPSGVEVIVVVLDIATSTTSPSSPSHVSVLDVDFVTGTPLSAQDAGSSSPPVLPVWAHDAWSQASD